MLNPNFTFSKTRSTLSIIYYTLAVLKVEANLFTPGNSPFWTIFSGSLTD